MMFAGYVFGGIAESIGWRACFFIEAAAGIPIVLIAVLVPNVRLNRGAEVSEEGGDASIKLQINKKQGSQSYAKTRFHFELPIAQSAVQCARCLKSIRRDLLCISRKASGVIRGVKGYGRIKDDYLCRCAQRRYQGWSCIPPPQILERAASSTQASLLCAKHLRLCAHPSNCGCLYLLGSKGRYQIAFLHLHFIMPSVNNHVSSLRQRSRQSGGRLVSFLAIYHS